MIISTIQREVTRTFNYSMNAGRPILKSLIFFHQKFLIHDLPFPGVFEVNFPVAILKKKVFTKQVHAYTNMHK